jgi:hypothetical protein
VAHIFGRFLPIYPLCPPAFGRLTPTTLGQICHRWREIALATSTLWRAIFLYINADDPAQYRRNTLRCLETWLRLSKSCPLSIRLEGPTWTSNHPENLVPFMAAISSECARWEYLRKNLAMKYRPFQEYACGILRSLRMRANWWDQGRTPVDALNLLTVVVDIDRLHSGPSSSSLGPTDDASPALHRPTPFHGDPSLVHCKVTTYPAPASKPMPPRSTQPPSCFYTCKPWYCSSKAQMCTQTPEAPTRRPAGSASSPSPFSADSRSQDGSWNQTPLRHFLRLYRAQAAACSSCTFLIPV